MINACNFTFGRQIYFWFIIFCLQGIMPSPSEGYSLSPYQKFQAAIIDYSFRINPQFKKISRQRTRYIIVHTSELPLDATLRVVSKGKEFPSGYKTPGGHAHYVIAGNGQTYLILDKRYRADHAGLSMWNKDTGISDISIGIELVGYHDAPITASQYLSVGLLLGILKRTYGLDDRDVLTHSQIAYGKPNAWFNKNHRGRKWCAKNFDRSRAGLRNQWGYDPDVRAGRLMADPELAVAFYEPPLKSSQRLATTRMQRSPRLATTSRVENSPRPALTRVQNPPRPSTRRAQSLPFQGLTRGAKSNIISNINSAWSIAGGDYDSETTFYLLPDGRTLSGDRIEETIGWNNLPTNTRVMLN